MASQLVCIRVRDVAGLAHEVLQVLPAHAAAQVLDKQLIVRARWRPEATRAALVIGGSSSHAPSQLDRDSLAHQLLAIELAHGILGVAIVVEVDKTEAVLEHDVLDAAVAAKEALHVAFSNIVVEPAHEHPGRHGFVAAAFATEGGEDRCWQELDEASVALLHAHPADFGPFVTRWNIHGSDAARGSTTAR